MRNNKLFIIATALSVIFVVLLGIIVFSSVQVVEDVTYDMAAPSPNEASVSTGLISADSSVHPAQPRRAIPGFHQLKMRKNNLTLLQKKLQIRIPLLLPGRMQRQTLMHPRKKIRKQMLTRLR